MMPEAAVSKLTVGEAFTSILVEDLGRAHIAQYAGAAGDFNRVHVDEVFATVAAGRGSVIAHGMLTMGLTATFVARLVGHDTLLSFGGRFLSPVAPGDTLECVATVSDLQDADNGRTVTLRLETGVLYGAAAFLGQAVARVPLP
jgi:acyl dehydratase